MRIGCLAVHYGKEYLGRAVWALAHACDEVHVFYTDTPSFGHAEAGMTCPDTREELVVAAHQYVGQKQIITTPLIWHDVVASSEGAHRQLMIEEAQRQGATLMAIADADEVWDPLSLQTALDAVEAENGAGRWLARFNHFWRSWKWSVHDGFRPVRILDLRHKIDGSSDAYLDEATQPRPIYHFGYAQSLPIMRYKFTCHGHKAEFKPDWFNRKFLAWDPYLNNRDLHPCINDFWSATPTSEAFVLDHLEELMPDHPHRHLEIIE